MSVAKLAVLLTCAVLVIALPGAGSYAAIETRIPSEGQSAPYSQAAAHADLDPNIISDFYLLAEMLEQPPGITNEPPSQLAELATRSSFPRAVKMLSEILEDPQARSQHLAFLTRNLYAGITGNPNDPSALNELTERYNLLGRLNLHPKNLAAQQRLEALLAKTQAAAQANGGSVLFSGAAFDDTLGEIQPVNGQLRHPAGPTALLPSHPREAWNPNSIRSFNSLLTAWLPYLDDPKKLSTAISRKVLNGATLPIEIRGVEALLTILLDPTPSSQALALDDLEKYLVTIDNRRLSGILLSRMKVLRAFAVKYNLNADTQNQFKGFLGPLRTKVRSLADANPNNKSLRSLADRLDFLLSEEAHGKPE